MHKPDDQLNPLRTPGAGTPGAVFCRTARLTLRNWRDADAAAFAAMCADPRVMRYFPGVLNEAESAALLERIRAHFDRCGYGPFAVELNRSAEQGREPLHPRSGSFAVELNRSSLNEAKPDRAGLHGGEPHPGAAGHGEQSAAGLCGGGAADRAWGGNEGASGACSGTDDRIWGGRERASGACSGNQPEHTAWGGNGADNGVDNGVVSGEGGEWIGFVGLAEVGADLPFAPAVEIAWRLRADFWGRGYATEAAQAALAFGFGQLGLSEIVAFTTETNAPSQRVMRRLQMRYCPAEDFDHPRLPAGHPLLRHRLYRLGVQAWRVSESRGQQEAEFCG